MYSKSIYRLFTVFLYSKTTSIESQLFKNTQYICKHERQKCKLMQTCQRKMWWLICIQLQAGDQTEDNDARKHAGDATKKQTENSMRVKSDRTVLETPQKDDRLGHGVCLFEILFVMAYRFSDCWAPLASDQRSFTMLSFI